MPKGPPPPDHIIGRKVTFFSIDTNVMEGKGFDFNRGALNVLQHQRPAWMALRLSDIVEREVRAHRMRDLTEAKQKLDSALSHMRRKAALDVTNITNELDALTVLESGERQFKNELQSFVNGLAGEVLPTSGENLASELFERYFAMRPPFEAAKDKKTEFPDAAALLVLEQHAKDEETLGVVISNDRGWLSFASKSEHLFCVKTLEEFTGLFGAMSEHVKELLTKIQDELKDQDSGCFGWLQEAIRGHVAEASWAAGDICSGYAHRLEGEIYEANVGSFEVDFASMQGWLTNDDEPLYVVEIPVLVSADVVVTVEFFQYDSIDHEELSLGSQDVTVKTPIEVSVFFTCVGELIAKPVAEWEIEVEAAAGEYWVDVGEVNLHYVDEDRDPYQD